MSSAPHHPQLPTEIPLSDGAVLKYQLITSFAGSHKAWSLHRDDAHIRFLDVFESEFVNSALKAGSKICNNPHTPSLDIDV